MKKLKNILIRNFPLPDGSKESFKVSYQIFGQELHTAPIILINHALTGNSSVAGEGGWWKEVVGDSKAIDLRRYTVIAFDIPGNGYNHVAPIERYTLLTTKIVGNLFWKALDSLGVVQLYAILGGSLGGSVAWEMLFQRPDSIQKLIPIACTLKSSDWLIGNVHVQESILSNSQNPLEDARKHAMLLYRTPNSFRAKFKGRQSESGFAVEHWLIHHAEQLKSRYTLPSYRLMNHLLKTIGENRAKDEVEKIFRNCKTEIHTIAVDSDYMFTREEQIETYKIIRKYKKNASYGEIKSLHGHDAFLIEFQQLNKLLISILS